MHGSRILFLAGVFAAGAIGPGCSWLPFSGQQSRDTTEAGVSATGSNEAVWMATTRPGLSAVGKDYLFVGPMTVNRDGRRQRYLWFAIGTTIDRHLTGAPRQHHEAVVLLVDGTPMTFELTEWENTSRASPYPLSIRADVTYAARVTSSQVRRLAAARVIGAYVTDPSGRSPVYSVVRGDPGDWVSSGSGSPADAGETGL